MNFLNFPFFLFWEKKLTVGEKQEHFLFMLCGGELGKLPGQLTY